MLLFPLLFVGAILIAFLIAYKWGDKIHKKVSDVKEEMFEEHTDSDGESDK